MSLATRAWLVWSLAAGYYAYGFFQRVAPSVIVADLMAEFAVGGAMLGTLSAAYFYAYAAIQVPVGVLLDRFGPRRLLVLGAAIASLGGIVFALASTLWLTVTARALIGAGVGVGYIATLKLASTWFPPRRFGLLAGLTLAAGTLGAVAAQLPLALAVEVAGWRTSLFVIALLGVLLCLTMAGYIQDRPDLPANPAAAPGPGSPHARASSLLAPMRHILGRAETWRLVAITGCIGAPILTFAGLWGVPYLVHVHGLPTATAGAITSLMLLAWASGGPFWGGLSDRLARRRLVLVVVTLAMAAAWLGWTLVPQPPLMVAVALALLIGFAGGGMVVAFAAARDSFGAEMAGTAMGIVNSSVLLFGAGAQTGFGWLLDLAWDGRIADGARIYTVGGYRLGFALLAGSALVAGLAALRLEAPRRRTTNTTRRDEDGEMVTRIDRTD